MLLAYAFNLYYQLRRDKGGERGREGDLLVG